MDHFCTYFDRHYLLQGLTMYRSLKRHEKSFCLHVLCFDQPTYTLIADLGLSDLHPIALEDFERGDEALRVAKENRSTVEYYFTCTPSLPLYVMDHVSGVEKVTYLDSDLFFFSDQTPIDEEMGIQSVLLIGHRFPEAQKDFGEQFGRYNVGYLAFRNDPESRACLAWWRERCLEWCHDRVEPDRYADQKYLDSVPERFSKVAVLKHKGANLARWNCMNYRLKRKDGGLLVDEDPLLFYHFNSFRIVNRWVFDIDFIDWELGKNLSRELIHFLYGTYISEIKETWDWLRDKSPEMRIEVSGARRNPSRLRKLFKKMVRRQLLYSVGPKTIF